MPTGKPQRGERSPRVALNYVSVKLTGEPYVKGSKTETGLYCDRVILAK